MMINTRKLKLAVSTTEKNINRILIINQLCRYMNMKTASAALPQLPQSTFSAFGCQLRESMSLGEGMIMDSLQSNERRRDAMFADIKETSMIHANMLFAMQTGLPGADLDALFAQMRAVASRQSRPESGDDSNSLISTKFVGISAFRHFFTHGKLADKALIELSVSDEDYLSGILDLPRELAKYAVSQATEGHTDSIMLCRNLIDGLSKKMIEFDFRNGPLRKKFDGLKWSLKKVEEIIYELSLVEGEEGPIVKRMKQEVLASQEHASLINEAELDEIRVRYETNDKLREDVIKQSRDVQKLSKQAVYSVHRSDISDASDKCSNALVLIKKISKKILQAPWLRVGPFSNSIEEFCEAMMTIEWVKRKHILGKAELDALMEEGDSLSVEEFVGGLADFTGEIGRIGVLKASARDVEAVIEIMQAQLCVVSQLTKFNFGGKFSKKLDESSSNLRKTQEILYDLRLLERGGRKGRERISEEPSRFAIGTADEDG